MPKEESRRFFNRYPCLPAEFKININGRIFKSELIDYSFGGLRVFIEDSPPVSKETVIDVDTTVPYVRSKGKIVWSKKEGSGLMVGLKKVSLPKTGFLRDYALADILIGLQRSNATGVLRISDKSGSKKIFLKDGDIIFSSSDAKKDRLGEYLFRTRTITAEQYKSFVDALGKSNKKEGAVLVDLKCVRPQEIPLRVRQMAEDVILDLFALEDGNYEFAEGPLPAGEAIPLKLSAANLIFNGIKKIPDPKKALDIMSINAETVLAFSSDPLDLFQNIALDPLDKKLLSFVNGKNSVRDIISLSGFAAERVMSVICALLSTRIIDIKGDETAPQFTAADIISGHEIRVEKEFLEKLNELYGNYQKLGYYGILGVTSFASSEEIKRRYYEVAKEFHPDKHFLVKSNEIKEKLNAIFSFATSAYSTLTDPNKRVEYDMGLSDDKPSIVGNKEMAKIKFAEGRNEFRKGSYQEASRLFGQSVYLDNKIGIYHFYYGLSLCKLKKNKEAERAISRALEIEPNNPDYLTELGYVYILLNFPRRAKNSFEKALKIQPTNARANEGFKKVEMTD